MKERLFEIIKRNGLTAWRFAELLDVQPSSISHILSGRNKPSFDFIEKILTRFPEINPDWLILGQGEIIRSGYNDELVIQSTEDSTELSLFDILDEDNKEEIITNVNIPDNENITSVSSSIITNVKQPQSVTNQPYQDEITRNITNLNTGEIERVMIFYTNGTFATYTPK